MIDIKTNPISVDRPVVDRDGLDLHGEQMVLEPPGLDAASPDGSDDAARGRPAPGMAPMPSTQASGGWRYFVEYVGMCAALLGLGGLLLFSTAQGWLLSRFMRPERRALYMRTRATVCFSRFLAGLQRSGLVQLDLSELDALRHERSLVIAPNHPSMIDAVLMISRLPDAVCIMKASIGSNVFFGGGAGMCGYVRNDCAHSMVRESIEAVRQGHQLLVFPEGTRSSRHPIGPLTGAFALIARRANAPVQTVLIETNSGFLGKGWPLWRKPDFPLYYRARLGPRIEPGARVDEVVGKVAECFTRELSGNRPPAPDLRSTRRDRDGSIDVSPGKLVD